MTNKLKELIYKYKELIVYIIFGGLTTVVSFASYFILSDLLHLHYQIAQWGSWILAVAFAFIVNKIFVFGDKDMSVNELFRQIWQFVSVRIVSGILEWLLLIIMVEIILISDGISKIIVSVITVIVNYIASKFIIFKKKG